MARGKINGKPPEGKERKEFFVRNAFWALLFPFDHLEVPNGVYGGPRSSSIIPQQEPTRQKAREREKEHDFDSLDPLIQSEP